MRIVMIGIGSIARKAYLPVLTARADVDLHLVTRDAAVLAATGAAYGITGLHQDLDHALDTGRFNAAFVHTATAAHAGIVERLLQQGIAVFVDKPLADDFDTVAQLVAAAERAERPLIVGFNRRHAPPYVGLRGIPHDTLLMHKHRRQEPSTPRETVFDDFIHVIDTLRFLSPATSPQLSVETTMRDGRLTSILLLLSSPEHKAIGMMNRNAGLDEEKLELVGGHGRHAVLNMSDTIDYDGAEVRSRRDDWAAVSLQRGFEGMIADVLDAVLENRPVASHDILETHRICELIVRHAEASAA